MLRKKKQRVVDRRSRTRKLDNLSKIADISFILGLMGAGVYMLLDNISPDCDMSFTFGGKLYGWEVKCSVLFITLGILFKLGILQSLSSWIKRGLSDR